MGCLIKWKEFSKVDFICPKCNTIQPEILNINTDNKNIEFHCMKCAENEYNSKYFNHKTENSKEFYYFNHSQNIGANNHMLEEDKNVIQKIKENILLNIFLEDKRLKECKEIIEKKNEQLKKIIKLNKKIKDNYQNYQNNYFYIKSLKNICKSFVKEKKRDSNDLKFLFSGLKDEIEISKKAIDKLMIEKNIEKEIEREEESIFLGNKQLNDDNIINISQIKFNQLKELDLSENDIESIEPLCDAKLPFLEYLNLSNNKIKNIEPFGQIIFKSLKYLFIQNNQIENIDVLLDTEFPTLEILRLDNNRIDENSSSFRKLLVLYNQPKNILIKNTEEVDKIRSKFFINNEKTIEVGGTEEGDLILKYLLIIVSSNNKIRKLNLSGNKIENPSILNRIQFKFLEELDLSVNNIKNLNFLKKMKAENLKKLYLNNNKINNLSLLSNIKTYFGNLEILTFNDNNCKPDDPRYKLLFDYLESMKLNLQRNN